MRKEDSPAEKQNAATREKHSPTLEEFPHTPAKTTLRPEKVKKKSHVEICI